MVNDNFVSFTSVVSGLLLCYRKVSANDIVHTISELASLGIEVSEVDDDSDISFLTCCVDISEDYSFSLKEKYDYSTFLSSDVMVFDFLYDAAGSKIISFLCLSWKYSELYKKNYYSIHSSSFSAGIKKRKKINPHLIPFFGNFFS